MAVSREGVVAASLEILDQYGLADLSMRRIGDALGVQAAAIYWHHANKQTLLAAVSDAILAAQIDPGVGQLAASLTTWGHDLRQVLLRHRDAAELVGATLAIGLGDRIPHSGAVRVFLAAGWPRADADRAALALSHFVLGHVMQEQTRQNLLGLGVLAPPAEALDQAGFEFGLGMLVRGATSWTP